MDTSKKSDNFMNFWNGVTGYTHAYLCNIAQFRVYISRKHSRTSATCDIHTPFNLRSENVKISTYLMLVG